MATVFLHPLPFDGSVWREVVDRLDRETIVVPSLYALGDSMDEWGSAVLDVLPKGSHTLVGNSIGVSCAAEVAHLAPARVERIVAIGGKFAHRPEPALCDEAVRVIEEQGLGAAWSRWWRPLFGRGVDKATVVQAEQCLLAQDPIDVALGVRVFHGRADRSDVCDRWRGRLDVMSGAEDAAPRPEVAAAALTGAASGAQHLVAGVGHYLPLEAPDRVAAVIDGTAAVSAG